MSTRSNSIAFQKGMVIAKEKIHHLLIGRLAELGEILLTDAVMRATYTSFTGNTLTSLAYGVYENSTLTDIVFISGKKPPIHVKVREGSYTYLQHPYEGVARGVSGKVPITDAWGYETSERVLKELCPKGGNGIIVTTGTEYSTFLEKVYDYNVLSDTAAYAESAALGEIKQWLSLETPIDRL